VIRKPRKQADRSIELLGNQHTSQFVCQGESRQGETTVCPLSDGVIDAGKSPDDDGEPPGSFELMPAEQRRQFRGGQRLPSLVEQNDGLLLGDCREDSRPLFGDQSSGVGFAAPPSIPYLADLDRQKSAKSCEVVLNQCRAATVFRLSDPNEMKTHIAMIVARFANQMERCRSRSPLSAET